MKKKLLYLFMALISLQIYAQEHPITGKVIDATDGMPLPGVNVLIEGTSTGVSTDFDGYYSINVPNNNASIIFTFLGYKSQTILVGSKTEINISLNQEASQLNEIVVIGYGSVRKKDLTGAVVSLGEDSMTIGASTSSAAQMIQGRAAGVEVFTGDGEPGQSLNIVIRGNTSISNSNQPLYVVDGFPIAAGVSIAPEDIETIDILKDAASAAIYGSRGSSGVILITTKKGRRGKTEISYSGYTALESLTGDVKYLNWDDSSRIINEQYAQGPNDGNPWLDQADLALGNNTNWLEAVTRDAVVKSHSIRASGGTDKSHFSLSINNLNQEGVFLNSKFNRTSIRLNADHKFGEKTKVGVNINISKIDSDAMNKRGGAYNLSPLFATLSASPGRASYNADGSLASTSFSRDTQTFKNPIGFFTERVNKILEWRTYANIFVEHKILDNFVAKVNAGFDHTSGTNSKFQPLEYSTIGGQSLGSIDESKVSSYLIEGTLDYKFKMPSEDHVLSLLAGASTQYDDLFSFGTLGIGFPNDKTSYFDLGSAENQFISSSRQDKRIISFFSRANYSYKGKYILTATIRTDGASQFGENNKWGTFPSVSAAWRIIDEDFLKDSKRLSNLKLRVSYGVTGNNNFSPYTSLARVGSTSTLSLDGVTSGTGVGSDGLFAPNPELKWETTKMINFGLDFGLWDDRLYGSIEVYNSNTDDLIIDQPLSTASTGFAFRRANIGSITNNGIELSLGAQIIDKNNLLWEANFNFATNNNEITKLLGDNPILLDVPRQPYGEVSREVFRQLIEGGQTGDFFGYTYRGVLQPGEVYSPQPNTTRAGSALYEDINNDGIIDSNDRSVIGNANPDFTIGFNNHFQYKGLYLDMFWQAVVGNDVFNFKAISSDRFLSEKALDRYSPSNPTGTRPGVDYFGNEYGSYVNTEFIEDASYGRLKNLTIGYKINTDKISWLNDFSVYIQGQNLITITSYSGYDPEVSFNYSGSQSSINRGVDDYGFPNKKTYSFGLKLSF